jgi:hypothetical protein
MRGSIKGDVKKKYFPDVLRRGCFFDIQPLFAAARLVAGAWFCFSSSIGGFGLRSSVRLLCAFKQRGQFANHGSI